MRVRPDGPQEGRRTALLPGSGYNVPAMETLRDLLKSNRVADLGPLPAPRLEPNATEHQAIQFLRRGRRGAVVVVEGLRPVGIFTERDVLNRMPQDDASQRRSALRDIMSQPPVTVRRQISLAESIERMVQLQHRHLVVVDRQGDLKGLLTSNDLIQFVTDQFPEETVNLPPHPQQEYKSSEGA